MQLDRYGRIQLAWTKAHAARQQRQTKDLQQVSYMNVEFVERDRLFAENNLLLSLAPGKRMMVKTRACHSYFTISPDGTRIIFGGTASMTPNFVRIGG